MNPVAVVWNNEYFRFFGVIILSLAVAQLFLFIIRNYILKITSKTKTEVDDRILSIISRPVYLAIFFTGLYIAFQFLTVSATLTKWVDRSLFIILVMLAAYVVSQLIIVLSAHWLRVEKRFEKTPKLVGKIISILVYLLAGVMVLTYFKINITPIIATLGIGGLAAGLALQSTLSNFFAGLHIISDRSFTVGDLIEINQLNIAGHIEDIGWRTTRIKTLQDTIAIVPNSKIAESVIINTEFPLREMVIIVKCGVAYDSDLTEVEKITLEVATTIQKTIEGAVTDFTPNMRYTDFGDSNINFSVALKIKSYTEKPLVRHEFIKMLKAAFEQNQIDISFPVRKIISS
ncbi:MAG: mechanosensitive ion channel family protein [Bacteroidota bacterium]